MDQDIKTVIQYPVGATEFDIPFDYLSRKFVRVSLVADDNRRLLSNITEYRYVSKTRVKLLVETTGFDRVEIRRFTSASERIVDFSDGSVLRAADLNVSQIQSAHIAEEARDAALMAMPEDDAGNLDARNRKIVRLAPGEAGTDAINKNQLDETLGEAGGILSDFEDVRDEIIQYISKFTDDTGAVRGVSYVYNNGRALGGETGFHIDITPPPLGVPYLSINGSKQYRGYHFTYDPITGNVQGLATPLEKDDFVVATTTESVTPIEDLYASTQGASMIGTLSGSTVEERIAEVEQSVLDSIDGIRVDSFIGMTDSDAIDAAIAEALRVNSYVKFSPRVYTVDRPVILPSKTVLVGTQGLTKIVASASWNGPVVMSKDAPAGDYLAINVPSAMVYGVYIFGIIIESGWKGTTDDSRYHTECLRIYGAGTILKGVRVGKCRGDGANLGGRGLTAIDYGAPSLYSDVRADLIGKNGITIGGSSDNHTQNIVVRNAGLLEHDVYYCIGIGPGGGTRGNEYHTWHSGDAQITPLYRNRPKYGLYLAGWDTYITNGHFEGAASAQIANFGGRNQVTNVRAYSTWDPDKCTVLVAGPAFKFVGNIGAPMNNVPANRCHAFQLGTADIQVNQVEITAQVNGQKFVNYVNAGGSNSIAVRGTLGIAGASGIGTLVTGTVPDDNELTIIAEPYKGKRLGLNLILTGDKGLTCRDVNSTGQISGVNALLTGKVMLTGLSSDIPTTPGTVYVDSNGNLKVKL